MKKTLTFSLVLAVMLVALPVMAQTNESSSTDSTVVTSTASTGSTDTVTTSSPEEVTAPTSSTTSTDPQIEGIQVDNITSIPSSFGLWWRGVKENVSLGLTFDPVKKAEKAIKYSEERMKIAELMAANSSDEKVQEKAQAMIERSQAMIQKVEAAQAKWSKVADSDKVQRLMSNIAAHQMNQEKAMNRIEQKLPEKAQERFNQLREKGLQASQRLMNALSNENIPADTKAKLEAVKARIEDHASTTRAFIEQRKELHDRIQAGDQSAIEELKKLNEERKADLKAGLEEFKQIRDAIKATTTQRIRERIENRTGTNTEIIKKRIENRIMNNGSSTSSMIRENVRQEMPRR